MTLTGMVWRHYIAEELHKQEGIRKQRLPEMLVLTRKKEQSVVINDNIEITIVDIQAIRSG